MARAPLGMNGKLYIKIDSTWTEVTKVADLSITFDKDSADVTTRANNGWSANRGTLKSGQVTCKILKDPDSQTWRRISEAFFSNDEQVEIMALSGPKDTEWVEGFWTTADVTGLGDEQNLRDGQWVSVTFQPDDEASPKYILYGPCDSGEPTTSTGASVYWDSSAEKYTFTASSNRLVGKLAEDYTTGGTIMTISVGEGV